MVSPTPRSSGEAKFSGAIFTHLTHWRPQIISEFYHLRRTAIKDLAAYIGFLTGFIGAAPFAWGLLSDQLASGSFVRGLWYFFGIVIASGLFTGTAGLGLGYAAGILWEQFHRHRRRENVKAKTFPEEQRTQRTELVQAPSPIPVTVCRGQRFRYPDPGARDALCALIGDRVSSVRSPSADRVDVLFDSGCELVMLRGSVAVA
jgi:hypothetical protein